MTDPDINAANVLAVQRAFATQGRSAALIEVMRRWPHASDATARRALDFILAIPIDLVPYRQDAARDKNRG